MSFWGGFSRSIGGGARAGISFRGRRPRLIFSVPLFRRRRR